MARIVVNEWLSLDGVVQAPGTPDEDRRGGFEYGGWHVPYFDELAQRTVVEGLNEAGGFLLGRTTYENFAGYWPNANDEEQVLAVPLNTKPKYVASTTLSEPLEWQNSTLLRRDVPEAVAALKESDDGDLHVIGSPVLVWTLVEHDLVDEYRLMIDPLILGTGKRLFPDSGARRALRLVETRATTTGAVLATYAAA